MVLHTIGFVTSINLKEIQSVIDLDKFDSPKQEYARNIWLVLYYGSVINPIDLLKLSRKKLNLTAPFAFDGNISDIIDHNFGIIGESIINHRSLRIF